MHRHPRYWPAPERFDPNRWSPEAAAERPKFAYFPFGGGPRICIGEQFAWTEMILTLAALARQYRLTPADSALPEIDPLITLRPKHPIRMRLSPRSAPIETSAAYASGPRTLN